MESIIDKIASSWILYMGIPIVFILIIMLSGLFYKPLKKSKKIGYYFVAAILIPSSIIIAIGSTGNYGLVKYVKESKLIDNKLCFLDEKTIHSKYGTRKESRLHIIEQTDGKRIKREFIGNEVSFAKTESNKIIFKTKNGFTIYNLSTLSIEKEINTEYLIKKFPELSEGIEKINDENGCLVIVAKTGLTYYYDATKDSFVSKPEYHKYDIKKYNYYANKIYFWDNGYEKDLFILSGKDHNDKRYYVKKVKNQNDETEDLISSESFIYGTFMGVSKEKDLILVISYTTTDRNKEIITALNFDLKTKWKISADLLDAKDFFSDKNSSIMFMLFNDNELFFNIEGFIFKVETETGKIIWKQRF